MRDRRKRNIIIGTLCCLLVFMGIGYAVLNQVLNITGTASVNSSWKILITDITQTKLTGSAQSEDGTPTFTDDSATFSAILKKPGDSITYTVTVANQGSIDAVLSLESSIGSEHKDISFSNDLISGEILKAGSERQFNVYVKFSESATTVEEVLSSYTIKLTYTQYDGNNLYDPTNVTTDNGVFKLSGNSLVAYDESMGTHVSIPAEIDGVPITTISSGAFKKTITSYNYDFKVILSSEGTPLYAVIFDESKRTEIENLATQAGVNITIYSVGDSSIPALGAGEMEGYYFVENGLAAPIFSTDSSFLGESSTKTKLLITSLDLSNATNLVSIGDFAFSNVSADEFETILPKAVRGETISIDSGLTSLTFGDNMNEIALGTGVFAGSNLEILKTYTTIKAGEPLNYADGMMPYPFLGSTIGKLVISPTETQKVISDSDMTLDSGVTIFSPTYGCISTVGELVINEGITEIPNAAFSNSEIDKVTLPSTLTTIKQAAFAGKNGGLTSVTLPNGLVRIGESAFEKNSLTTVTIPKTVTEIGSNAFYDNPLTTVTLKGRSSTSGMTLGSNWNGTGTIVYQP